jgi:hypothetical protein
VYHAVLEPHVILVSKVQLLEMELVLVLLVII